MASRFGLTFMAVDPPGEFTSMVDFADANGFDFFWVCDSSLHARYVYAYLTLVATRTARLRFGPNCTHPYTRHPAINFNALCTLDELSGGRAIMNVGAGDRPVTEVGRKQAKREVIRQMVEVGRRLLAGEKITYASEAFSLQDAQIHYGRRADLPIYITVSGPKMCELAGELADGVMLACGSDPALLRFALGHVAEGARRAGKAFEAMDRACLLYTSIRDRQEEAIEDTRVIAAWYPQTAPALFEAAGGDPGLAARIQAAYRGGHFHEAKEAARMFPDEMVLKFTLAGPPAFCAERIRQLQGVGLTHFEIFPIGKDRHETARRFAREVMPQLAS
jgi:5,10-methylenetetrahydromethanopterin reductase